ncbi:MAG TPA: HAD-IA family hydrolase, partial [Candidatus Limnocylindrales bacterium]|nr:HAD-IA family hydrolase [Candidatus Limnocylindrales bacterium]
LADPSAVVFDLDGTLVDTVETRIESWLKTFEEIGVKAEHDHVARLIGADGKRLAKEVAQAAGKRIDDDRAEGVDKRSGEIYDEINTNPKPIAGVRQLLLALSASNLPWAIATSSRREQTTVSVAALKLPTAPRIVDGSHVKNAKPAPDLLVLAAQQLRTPPATTWYVGDASWDMLAAKAAGMIGIGVAYGAVRGDGLREAGARVVTTHRSILADLRRRGAL